MLDCFKAQERVNGPKEQEDKTLRIKDTSGLHLYRVRPSHSFTPLPSTPRPLPSSPALLNSGHKVKSCGA